MKIFLSWSGERSKQIALLLYKALPNFIQTCDPWMSEHSIESGVDWFNSIDKAARDPYFGIICLTPENMTEPWILYEAGLLRKGTEASRVPSLLIDLKPTDVPPPLGSVNNTFLEKESFRKMLLTFNKNSGNSGIAEDRLHISLEKFWPEFEEAAKKIVEIVPGEKAGKRPAEEITEEILMIVRSLQIQGYANDAEYRSPFYTIFSFNEDSGINTKSPGIERIAEILKTELEFNGINAINSITILVYGPIECTGERLNRILDKFEALGYPRNALSYRPILKRKP